MVAIKYFRWLVFRSRCTRMGTKKAPIFMGALYFLRIIIRNQIPLQNTTLAYP